ncbi:GFA family protein [Neoroseomonas oryzicola]|uniref:GFA family protein n=1 Tax=Neoroseomonas oryzicola TaxID=535904 RepID=A0A9X9WLG5_9PROT|nr:GFA family protein [Neoroseomonas oryzicola]MBR0661175.1 GFA family protein [Neoroseomonas oryzicola]NKE17540.1 GFA family protein [Neoroseomonas oryzicola]
MDRTAQCLCGGLRAIVSAPPQGVTICHCRDCQRRSGVPLTCNAFFRTADVRLEGAHRVYVRDGQEGRKVRHHFCPDCGTTVFSQGEKFPGLCMVVVGAFADPDFPAPTASVFEETMHPWVLLPPGIEHYAQGRAAGALKPKPA